jgi:hypothetical protein
MVMFAISLRRNKMINNEYTISNFIQELQNLYMVRLGMSISESSRYIVDTIEDIELSLNNDVSAFEYFQEDLANGVEV